MNSLQDLTHYRRANPPAGYPGNLLTLYAPVDDVHGALIALLNSAQHSLVVAMYGFDDNDLAAVLQRKLSQENCYVQLTLDKSQSAGVHERGLLAQENYPATSIAIGTSEHGAIMHLKMVLIDGIYLVTGSTNWSGSAEGKQDNQLTVIADPYVCAEARSRVDAIHANMLNKETPAT